MKHFYLLLILSVFIFSSCEDKPVNDVFCQGQVVQETLRNAETAQRTSRTFLICADKCEDGSRCDSIVKNYDPPLANGVIREVWCGCRGEQTPQGCDVILQTIRVTPDSTYRIAKCTSRDKSCAVSGDSCLARYRDIRDTIRSATKQKDSLYRQRWTTTCECTNRGS